MKKGILISALLAAAIFAGGCQYFPTWSEKPKSTEPVDDKANGPEGQVAVQIFKGDAPAPAAKIVVIHGALSVLQVTRRVTTVRTEFKSNGQERVLSVDGVASDPESGKVWVYEVNGIIKTAGPNAVYVGNGDIVRWHLQ